MRTTGRLVLSDGCVFEGISFGADVAVAGEVVFNTGMVGYPESLTDPSYTGQILVLTYPLVGNYGVPPHRVHDVLKTVFESGKLHIKGLIVAEYCEEHSHWSAASSLSQWLKDANIPALYGIDTRALTKRLREQGVMLGKVVFNNDIALHDPGKDNLVATVSPHEPVIHEGGKKKVVLIDCGAKANIVRCLLARGVTVIRVPWDHDISRIAYDGIIISNGPGDPTTCTHTIAHVRHALRADKPIFGICLGNQILALAAGGTTYKLKYGHRGQNQPCTDLVSGRCYITSQNHGYAVDMTSLSAEWKEWFVNANDGTNEGIRHATKPFFSVQFHPEHCPGPVDTEFLFDRFVELL